MVGVSPLRVGTFRYRSSGIVKKNATAIGGTIRSVDSEATPIDKFLTTAQAADPQDKTIKKPTKKARAIGLALSPVYDAHTRSYFCGRNVTTVFIWRVGGLDL